MTGSSKVRVVRASRLRYITVQLHHPHSLYLCKPIQGDGKPDKTTTINATSLKIQHLQTPIELDKYGDMTFQYQSLNKPHCALIILNEIDTFSLPYITNLNLLYSLQ